MKMKKVIMMTILIKKNNEKKEKNNEKNIDNNDMTDDNDNMERNNNKYIDKYSNENINESNY